ncbi:MAG: 23S rRNA (pseudouridine(1915)-N(3))-methyltransferase RlmH [Bdellovibrionales bacterium]|jgi:23S rRNA (pseudouridine1915-N3)-methyltransferase
MKSRILAVGKVRGAQAALCDEYIKRLTGGFSVRELATQNQKAENEAILAALPAQSFVVILDEHGQDLTSRELAHKMAAWQDQGVSELVLVIGGADGLTAAVKERADFCLSLGHKTWPHQLARVMLIEQLYRAQQINNGHPYHRD